MIRTIPFFLALMLLFQTAAAESDRLRYAVKCNLPAKDDDAMKAFGNCAHETMNYVIREHSSSSFSFEQVDKVRSNESRTSVILSRGGGNQSGNSSHRANYVEDFPIPDYFRLRGRRLGISGMKEKFTEQMMKCLNSKRFPRTISESEVNCKGKRL
eukprot:CAMPEP_0118695288 /NCGR_PEP_ID=MMETSP0800-20121206/13091_1 /TAXON_ID=210618 ORGANISM="Striatella unipunctata, Strain CCMP2910" /NCGR_SAMPLE_ID=MMETSP0800 /ASSEMBLY_ACC=CAM_ASM_000638 /LENGTH=155 /DNA_ID=CAMNT_0006594039 /DNA_START=79 /DNA_END=546 /DNA_ORIENTATION=+